MLAVPTYQLARQQGRVSNGQLHPVLSNMFRVTDGVRLTTHHMLFVPVSEATTTPDTPVTAHDIHAYAERNYSLHSDHGVCAGPGNMIDQFLRVLVEGQDTASSRRCNSIPRWRARWPTWRPRSTTASWACRLSR